MTEPAKGAYIWYARTIEDVRKYNNSNNPFLLRNCQFLPLDSLATNFDEGYYKLAMKMLKIPFLVKDRDEEYVRAAVHTSKDGIQQYMLVCGPFQEDRMEAWMAYEHEVRHKKLLPVYPPANTSGITQYM